MNYLDDLLLALVMFIGGFLIELILTKLYFRVTKTNPKEHHFRLGRYVFLLLFPLLGFIVLVGRLGTSLFLVFLSFSLLGTALEWLVGFSYHKIVGTRLWTYHRLSLGGYTSLLSIPIWGLGGVLFWLLIQVLTP